jgi:hypothetical protein
MQTKLTLRLEEDLITEAKQYARKEGKSLSQIVADYFSVLSASSAISYPKITGPVTNKLIGCLSDRDLDESEYKSHLVRKYQ